MAGTAGRSGRRPKPTARKALAGNMDSLEHGGNVVHMVFEKHA